MGIKDRLREFKSLPEERKLLSSPEYRRNQLAQQELSRQAQLVASGEVSKSTLLDEVLKPGNLVHGIIELRSQSDWQSILRKGIKPGKSGYICMSLLSNLDIPERYLESMHYGPKAEENCSKLSVGFILSNDRMLRSYYHEMHAVGHEFFGENLPTQTRTHRTYEFNQDKSHVFGIQIRRPEFIGNHYRDEVRIYPSDEKQVKVTRDHLVAIVIYRTDFSTVYRWTGNALTGFPLPVLSPDLELIAPSLG